MIRSLLLVPVCVLATLPGLRPAEAAPALSRDPVNVRLQLDRQEYLEREPVFAEWSIANSQATPVDIMFWRRELNVFFSCAAESGVSFPVRSGVKICFVGSLPLITLQRGEAIRGWVDLREYEGLHGQGQFTIQCEYNPGDQAEKAKVFSGRVISNKVTFRIVEAKGSDVAAVESIDQARRKKFPAQFHKTIDPALDEAKRRRALGEKESQTGLLFHGRDLREALFQSGSARFAAAALFYQGRADMEFHLKTEEQYRNASESFKACSESKGASRYLKGLALMHWMQCQLEVKTDEAHRQAEQLAERLLKDYPDSCMADEAGKALKALRPDAK